MGIDLELHVTFWSSPFVCLEFFVSFWIWEDISKGGLFGWGAYMLYCGMVDELYAGFGMDVYLCYMCYMGCIVGLFSISWICRWWRWWCIVCSILMLSSNI